MSNLKVHNLFSVKGRVLVITGGESGIGAMFTKALGANEAAKVYMVGHHFDKLQEVANTAQNKLIVPIQGDITWKDPPAAIASQIEKETGFINCIIANSGATDHDLYGVPQKPQPTFSELHKYLWGTPISDFNHAFMANTTACFYTLLTFLPLLDAGNKSEMGRRLGVKSQFIATSSIGAFSRRPGMEFAYTTSTVGVIHLVKQFCPGFHQSDIGHGLMGRKDLMRESPVSPEMIPLTRAGTEEDAGGDLLFLCCHGNILISDGVRMLIVPATYYDPSRGRE
ncbi:NAD(P)-binding protein [Zopfia rhizophila CBS 207.26]|uniref:NAD(P)-binding protein n=1 Tax=Zopfia rhizophila CBS 207.26 TaxID=1314779 RepID=A0A6A6ECW1_9PEZI|nr:NAD(P)-binding protein [Zopfia rhizophila CBS 207.26]